MRSKWGKSVARIPKSLLDAEMQPLWRESRRFVASGMRLTKTTDRKTSHFAGGPATHARSKCPGCGKRWTLLWDLDLSDPLIPDYVRDGFAPAERLPCYICWQCVAASYRVTSNARVQPFAFDSDSEDLLEDETPFVDSPNELPRREIAFERIPSTIDALLSLEDIVGLDELDPAARRAIDGYYGEPMTSGWNLSLSQFGGQPLPYQGHKHLVCPNSKCPTAQLSYPYGDSNFRYLMKEMALIHFDDEPELKKHCFQLLYSVCPVCFSLRAGYRCS